MLLERGRHNKGRLWMKDAKKPDLTRVVWTSEHTHGAGSGESLCGYMGE